MSYDPQKTQQELELLRLMLKYTEADVTNLVNAIVKGMGTEVEWLPNSVTTVDYEKVEDNSIPVNPEATRWWEPTPPTELPEENQAWKDMLERAEIASKERETIVQWRDHPYADEALVGATEGDGEAFVVSLWPSSSRWLLSKRNVDTGLYVQVRSTHNDGLFGRRYEACNRAVTEAMIAKHGKDKS